MTASAGGAGGPPEGEEEFVRWLQERPEAELRRDLESLVREAPGTRLMTLNCQSRPCQTNIHADSPEHFAAFLEAAGAKFRGHVAVIASVDHPGAPDRVVASLTVGTEDKRALLPIGSTWNAPDAE